MSDTFELELRLLLEAIHARYQYDFRSYALASLRRRVEKALPRFGCASVSQLQHRVLHDPLVFPELLQDLTVQVSDLFRDPEYWRAFREAAVPLLRTYPSVRVWVAGCAGGEEVVSFAILLAEEGLLDRATLYATDISAEALRQAASAIYALDRLPRFEENHRRSGGTRPLSDFYTAAYEGASFRRALRDRAVFADHSLATDGVFAEVQVVSCRNVLIYFDRGLQDRALAVLAGALVPRGFLGLGSKETLRFTAQGDAFEELVPGARIYRKR